MRANTLERSRPNDSVGLVGDSTNTAVPTPGMLIGDRYRLEQRIDSGGMAQVWRASDLILNRMVAVKVLHPHLLDDPAFVERFRREATAAAGLNHPNIVSIFDTCSTPDLEAIVMELIDGTSLRQVLDVEKRLDQHRTVELGVQISAALEAAHARGLVHRDVKPANILIATDGSVRLADFGIAKSDQQTEMTVAGSLVGTATYLAPEQVEGGTIDGRTDLYALGVVLYEALTGAPPFVGDTAAATALARLHQAPVPIAQRRSGIRPALADVVMRCLERSPDDRYPSAAAANVALSQALTTTTGEFPVVVDAPTKRSERSRGHDRSPRPPAASPDRRRPPRSKLGTATLVALLGSAVVVIVLLVVKSAPKSGPPATTVAPQSQALAVQSVAVFDPPPGDGHENDTKAPLVADGLTDTKWTTESYNAQQFGTKAGVGLLLTLQQRSTVHRVEIDSPNDGWSVQVYLLDAAPQTVPANPAATATAITGSTALATSDGVARVVLVWITRLGDGPRRFNLDVSEIRVTGRPSP